MLASGGGGALYVDTLKNHLGLQLWRVGQDRLVSDPVVVRIGGQH